MKPFCLEVRGALACFTRPEMKAERVSYDVITPSAARAVFESILWKPAIRWRIQRIDVLAPVKWVSVRRNEVGSVVPTRSVLEAMASGRGALALYADEDRQQRAGLFLRDVAYRLYADLEVVDGDAMANPGKYLAMFTRRATSGQCINQPYLGCREFAARFRLVDLVGDAANGYEPGLDEPSALTEWTADLGWMLYDMDFRDPASPKPTFFRARVSNGVLDLRDASVHS